MPELTAADVELYTGGRLSANDVETWRVLRRALRKLRNYCEWHVTPVQADTVVLDGSGSRTLMLPTQKLVTLTSVVEDGFTINLADVSISNTKPVLLRKDRATGWPYTRWSHDFGSVVVQMTHGYTEDEAEDWRLAVLDACDKFSQMSGGGLKRYKVRDVEREWFESQAAEEVFNTNLVEPFRLKAPV